MARRRHIPFATFASPITASLTADFSPSAIPLQGKNDAAPGICRPLANDAPQEHPFPLCKSSLGEGLENVIKGKKVDFLNFFK